jgi:hypothetical protein
VDLSGPKPTPKVVDPSDNEEDHRPMRPTSRTPSPPAWLTPSLTTPPAPVPPQSMADPSRSSTPSDLKSLCAKDHLTTHLANPIPCRASSTDATTKHGRPIGIRYAIGSKESVQQLPHPAAGPLHLPNRQRSCTRVLGLNGRTEPLSDGGGRRAASRKKKKESGYDSSLKEVTGGRASEGARGGELDPTTADLATPPRSSERKEQAVVVSGGVPLGLTLTPTPQAPSPFIPSQPPHRR